MGDSYREHLRPPRRNPAGPPPGWVVDHKGVLRYERTGWTPRTAEERRRWAIAQYYRNKFWRPK